MKKLITTTALAVSLAVGFSGSADAFGQRKNNPKPPSSYKGQWYTTPAGCSYSKGQAPGEAPRWYLILNPHHIGQPPAKRGCPMEL